MPVWFITGASRVSVPKPLKGTLADLETATVDMADEARVRAAVDAAGVARVPGRLCDHEVRRRGPFRGHGGRTGAARVKVTIVEPGFFRMDFLDGSSLRTEENTIADYAASAGTIRKIAVERNHAQPRTR